MKALRRHAGISGLWLLLLAPIWAAPPTPTDFTRYVITDYGAAARSDTVNTTSIQSAIDRCAANGGGTW